MLEVILQTSVTALSAASPFKMLLSFLETCTIHQGFDVESGEMWRHSKTILGHMSWGTDVEK